MRPLRSFFLLLCLGLVSLLLAGCAGTRLVDSDVQAFSQLQVLPVPTTYRFERLPSQQAYSAQQDKVEALARQALAKVGLIEDPRAPYFSAQVYARTDRLLAPDYYWYDPFWGGWAGWGGWGSGFYGGISMRFPPPTEYRREVGLILRESASGRVVYETHAQHDGVWSDDLPVFAAMFDAALQGFPTPPAGPRRVNVEIPR
ncbi:MAG: DUF4136 domain-containing protein [Pseudomonadota bacterium]